MNNFRSQPPQGYPRDGEPSFDPRFQSAPAGYLPYGGAPAMPDMGAGQASTGSNLFKTVHKLLRGRYTLTLCLASALGVAGAVVGFKSTKPMFLSEGTIRLNPNQGGLVGPAQPYVNPDRFAQTQATLLQRPQLLQKVIADDRWRKAGYSQAPDAVDDVADAMHIRVSPNSDFIYVQMVSEDREYARIAATLLLEKFKEDRAVEQQLGHEQEFETLSNELTVRKNEIETLRKQIAQLSEEFGTPDLGNVYQAAEQTASMYRLKKISLEEQMRARGLLDVEGTGKPKTTEPVTPKTPADIALVDPAMRELLRKRQDLELQIEAWTKVGYKDEWAPLQRARQTLAQVNAEIDVRVRQYNGGEIAITPNGTGVNPGDSDEVLRQRYEEAKRAADAATENARQIAVKSTKIQELTSQLKERVEYATNLESELRRRMIDQQYRSKGLQEVAVGPDVLSPSEPTVDKRKTYAAAGLVFGGTIPIAAMLLIGLIDRRFRYSDDGDHTGLPGPLLGILPILPKDMATEEQRAMAAHCVHQIRLLMQINAQQNEGGSVYALTSPTSGDGKTSLTLSLGLSYAASGARTLLIDLDLVGTGLTSNLDIRNRPGVVAAIRSGTIKGYVEQTQIPGLSIIPCNAGDDAHVSRISTKAIQRLIAEARENFDTVLIDTGPILGSLEASMCVGLVDGVVLVVGRGQQSSFVQKAFNRIHSLGGRVLGVVFNRATGGDFRRSVTTASVRTVPNALPDREALNRAKSRLSKAGPIAQTLAMEIGVSEDNRTGMNGTSDHAHDETDDSTGAETDIGSPRTSDSDAPKATKS